MGYRVSEAPDKINNSDSGHRLLHDDTFLIELQLYTFIDFVEDCTKTVNFTNRACTKLCLQTAGRVASRNA